MRKITGAYRSMLGAVEFHPQELPLKNPGAFMPAVIAVGERNDAVPEVWTKKEVEVLLTDIMDTVAIASKGKFGVNIITGVAKRYGITLTP